MLFPSMHMLPHGPAHQESGIKSIRGKQVVLIGFSSCHFLKASIESMWCGVDSILWILLRSNRGICLDRVCHSRWLGSAESPYP